MNLLRVQKDLGQDEGRRSKVYTCSAGKLSIGIGRNLEDLGLSEDEIDYLFANDVKRVRTELHQHFPWWTTMNEVRQNVIFNMCFNLGYQRLRRFKKTIAAMQAHDYETAANEMRNSLWATQVKGRADRLIQEMRTGIWP